VSAPTGYQFENPPAAVSAAHWLRKLNEVRIDGDADNRLPGSFDANDPYDTWK
jgi:hypothetical protein